MTTLSIIKRILLVLIFLILPAALGAEGVLPVGSAEFEFIYDRLEHADAHSLDKFNWSLGPYPLDSTRGLLGPFSWLRDLDSRRLALFSCAQEDFHAAKASRAQGFESFHGGLAARPLEQVFAYGRFSLDEQLAEDPAYGGKKWRGLAGGIDDAFVQVRLGNFSGTIGRFASFWGPRSSLVLASGSSMDGLACAYTWGRLTLSYRLARLDGLNPEDDEVTQFENRFLAAHRLDLHLSDRIRLGFFESAIFGGPGRQVELYYLNPILFFHASQLNDGTDDNTLLGFDYTIKPGRGLKIYGQVLVDDYQVDDHAQSDREPNQVGWITGFYAADIVPGLDLKTEYARVPNWTFNQPLPRNRYLYKDEPIGAAPGNDYDRMDLALLRWFGPELFTAARFSRHRQGEGAPTADWTAPWLEIEGEYSEPFPTGTVQTTTTMAAQLKGFLGNYFFVDLTAGVDWIDNFDHVSGDDRTVPFLRLTLSSFLSTRVAVD